MSSLEERRDNMRVTFGLFTKVALVADLVDQLDDSPVKDQMLALLATPPRDLA